VRRRSFRNGVWALVVTGAMAVVVASACLVSEDGSPYLIDGGDLGPCSGQVAREIPATLCPKVTCCSKTAFALCLGTSYSDCSCALIAPFTLVNASGRPLDADIELGGECGAEEGGTESGPSEGGEQAGHG
jgi:hypothetical protein